MDVPYLEGPRVAPQGQTPYVDSPTVQNQTGEQLQQAGRAIEGVGAQATAVFEDRLREVNQLRIDEAISEAKARANDLTFDEKEGWSFVRGKDALERESGLALSEEYGDRYDKELDDIEGGLSNDAQRAAFAQARIRLGAGFRGEINQHEAKEYETWKTSVLEGVIQDNQRDIALHYDDPERTARSIDAIKGALYEAAKLKGTDRGDHLEGMVRKVVSDSHRLAVAAMLEDGNWTAAQTYLDKNKESLTEDDLFKIDVAIGREEDNAIATEAADEYIQQIFSTESASAPEDFVQPVSGAFAAVSDGGKFGNDRGTHKHGGVDLPRPAGTPISATAGGVVTRAEFSDTYGNVVYIKHDNGMETRYAHMQGFANGIKKGTRVNRGQILGGVGSTGRSSGPHLHYEVRDAKGNAIDPTKRHTVTRTTASGPGLSDLLLAMRNDPRLRGHPERLAAAEQQVRSVYAAKQADQAVAQESARDAAFTALLQNGGDYSALPASVRASLDGSDLPGVLSFAGSVQEARRAPEPESGSNLWALTKADIASGKVSNVSDLLKMRPYLSDSDYKDLVGDVTAVKKGDGAKVDSIKNADAAFKYIDAELAAIGIDTSPGDEESAAELGKFRAAFYRQYAVAEREKGGNLTGEEARKIGLSLIAETGKTEGGFLGFGASKVRGYQLPRGTIPYSSIPVAAKQNIARDLRAAGITPTEARVVAVYAQRTYE